MFIAYSKEIKTNRYTFTSQTNACTSCGARENLVLEEEVTVWKLFWLLPLFRLNTYALRCPVCGSYKVIPSKKGKDLKKLSLYQQNQPSAKTEPFSPEFDDENLHGAVGNLGEKLYQLRRSLYMSQEQFGEKIGVSRQTICKWELDKAQPDARHIENIIKAYALPLDYFEEKEQTANAQTENIPPVAIEAAPAAPAYRETIPYPYVHKKGSPVLLKLAITFGVGLMLFNLVTIFIHDFCRIQFPIFYFYIGAFIVGNAMLIPVGICAMAKRRIAASLLDFLFYVVLAVFTLCAAIPAYEKPQSKEKVYFHETFITDMDTPLGYQEFLSLTENRVLFQSYLYSYTPRASIEFKLQESDYDSPEDTSIAFVAVDREQNEYVLERGYLLDPVTLSYKFTVDFNEYPYYRLYISNAGVSRFRVSWEAEI